MATFQNTFIFKLKDKISPNIKKIERQMRQSTQKIRERLKKIDKQMVKTADKIKGQTVKVGRSFKKLGDKIGNVGKKMMSLGTKALIGVTTPLVLLGRKFINAASNYEEAVNKVDVAFGGASQSVKDFAKTAGENFGIDRGRALDMAALFGDMATGMGINQNKAAGLSKKLVALAGDMASFKNVKLEHVKTALAGIFTGEPESLKRMGIVQTIENLEEFARGVGIMKKVADMTQAEKVMLRFNFLLDKSKNSVGDFKRTQDSYANSVRTMQTNFHDLSISFGQRMLPTATKFANALGEIFLKINKISPENKDLIIKIGALAAAIGPLLIALGGLAVAFKLLIAPGAILAVQFAAIGTAAFGAFKLVTDFSNTINNMVENLSRPITALRELKNLFFDLIGLGVGKGKFKGVDIIAGADKYKQLAKQQEAAAAKFKLNQSFSSNTMINSRNKTEVGGNIAVEILSAEKTKTKITPAKNSPVGFTGKNTIIGGSY